jgi:hypothetical protein
MEIEGHTSTIPTVPKSVTGCAFEVGGFFLFKEN